MKKLTTKLMLALSVLGFAGGIMAFTPLAPTAAAATQVWVGQVNTVHEIKTDKNGDVIFDGWTTPQEVRCSTSYYLVWTDHKISTLAGGVTSEKWFFTVVTY